MMLISATTLSFAGKNGLTLSDKKCTMVVFKLKKMLRIDEPLVIHIRDYFKIPDYKIRDNEVASAEKLVNILYLKDIPVSDIKDALTENGGKYALQILKEIESL